MRVLKMRTCEEWLLSSPLASPFCIDRSDSRDGRSSGSTPTSPTEYPRRPAFWQGKAKELHARDVLNWIEGWNLQSIRLQVTSHAALPQCLRKCQTVRDNSLRWEWPTTNSAFITETVMIVVFFAWQLEYLADYRGPYSFIYMVASYDTLVQINRFVRYR